MEIVLQDRDAVVLTLQRGNVQQAVLLSFEKTAEGIVLDAQQYAAQPGAAGVVDDER